MAYKPTTEEEEGIISAYDTVKDTIITGMMASGMEEVKTVSSPSCLSSACPVDLIG